MGGSDKDPEIPYPHESQVVRASAIAGRWYSAHPPALQREIQELLDSVKDPVELQHLPAAIVTPHAGYQWSGPCAAHLYRSLQGPVADRIRRVILLAPSHHASVRGISTLPIDAYETPLGRVPIDRLMVAELLTRPGFKTVKGAHREEHADEIQLPFLQTVLRGRWKLVDLVVQGTDPADWDGIAGSLLPWINNETLIIASTDFTHFGDRFGYTPFSDEIPENLKKLDMGAVAQALKIDPAGWTRYYRNTGITVCGYEPVGIVLTLVKRLADAQTPPLNFEGQLLNYTRSGDINGDFSSSVSYAAILFQQAGSDAAPDGNTLEKDITDEIPTDENPEKKLSKEEQAYLLNLARQTLEETFALGRSKSKPLPNEFTGGPLEEERGVFVTLQLRNRLRGCIGSIAGHEPLAEGVAHQAIQSAFHDPRFSPLTKDELPHVRIEISVLTPMKPVADIKEIVIGRDGILLEQGPYRAVFLPQVATEQGWDLHTTLTHLSQKAGLRERAWKEPETIFYTFQAQLFEESD
ncbi:MAG: AmmeMemoRadiSam system protein B [Candidatus Eisenbacteria bacterium]|uniref:AmmeMemoRadiSam system protein B n=1 Tax=Eiseniibacteriota bacterium TaxID=2212470 RepID=A0A948W639_UNCEI|nr:AmmeMemoRadiSam system protein B [Candidatus Eisenbacteria bacterium]MBU1950244.1 AmmeMemoRadiSam system protein B [Candidatus Eisenbacteria bacterium]MBU2690700.1 AmmeMemoRadiSam system protein B [Candidatus Eisenbacteria bacterium]